MAHTASGALHFGISPEKLAAVANFAASPLFSAAEKSALSIAEAAGKAPNGVNDAMFAELRKHWSENKVVEIVAAIAATGFVNRWNATMATPLEDEPMEVGEKHLAPHGWTPGPHRR
jgi:alkylhydroperoxidase family enzyme